MTRKELIAKIARDTKMKQQDVSVILTLFLDTITEVMAKGDQLNLIGFGSFGVRERSAHTGINPLTKQPLELPAKNVPYFKPSKVLKNAVNR